MANAIQNTKVKENIEAKLSRYFGVCVAASMALFIGPQIIEQIFTALI